MDQSALLRIGQLSEQSGKSHRALRLYEERGLLQPRERTESGYRLYGEEALIQLRWIERLQLLGFSLPEIQAFAEELQLESTGVDLMQSLQRFYLAKKAEVEAKIIQFQHLQQELEQALGFLNVCGGCSSDKEPSGCLTCGAHQEAQQQVDPHTGCMELMSKITAGEIEERGLRASKSSTNSRSRTEASHQGAQEERALSFPDLITAPLKTVT